MTTKLISSLAVIICLAAPFSAYARGISVTRFGRDGGVYNRQVNHTPGNFSASRSATLPNGNTASRSLASQKTDTGRTTQASAKYLDGKTASYQSTSTKTDTGFTREATAMGPNGGTVAKAVTVSNQNGVVSRTVSSTRTPAQP